MPRGRQSRTPIEGGQSAFCGDIVVRQGIRKALRLRRPLLRPWRNGKPHQGSATRPVRRPSELPHVPRKCAEALVLDGRPTVGRHHPQRRVGRHGVLTNTGGHTSNKAVQDRRTRFDQRKANLYPSLQCVPKATAARPSLGAASTAGLQPTFGSRFGDKTRFRKVAPAPIGVRGSLRVRCVVDHRNLVLVRR